MFYDMVRSKLKLVFIQKEEDCQDTPKLFSHKFDIFNKHKEFYLQAEQYDTLNAVEKFILSRRFETGHVHSRVNEMKTKLQQIKERL